MFERIRTFFRRPPDFLIGGPVNPYLRRWWVIPRNYKANIYLHNLLRDDDDRALHDHPWPWCSIMLRGAYYEITEVPYYQWWPTRESVYRSEREMIDDTLRGEGYFMQPGYTDRIFHRKWWGAGSIRFGKATKQHRLELDRSAGECWTLFLTWRAIREWGFWCPKGFVPWREFLNPSDKGLVGRGCGEMDADANWRYQYRWMVYPNDPGLWSAWQDTTEQGYEDRLALPERACVEVRKWDASRTSPGDLGEEG